MSLTFGQENKFLGKVVSTLSAGAVASFVTQPFEVMKTNMINAPTLYMRDLHRFIVRNGWSQYMRGGSLAVLRQSYGFAIYTGMIQYLNSNIENNFPNVNKHVKYSVAAVTGKLTAMMFEAPLTLLKTRLEVISSTTFSQELKRFSKNPVEQLTKGLGITLLREGSYSLIHYNAYRYTKDEILSERLGINSTFVPAFIAGIMAITISQPFEVLRSKISLSSTRISMMDCLRAQMSTCGWRGLFTGYLPRLLRKPINSGVSWTIIESLRPTF